MEKPRTVREVFLEVTKNVEYTENAAVVARMLKVSRAEILEACLRVAVSRMSISPEN